MNLLRNFISPIFIFGGFFLALRLLYLIMLARIEWKNRQAICCPFKPIICNFIFPFSLILGIAFERIDF